jgi:hypothetical protein
MGKSWTVSSTTRQLLTIPIPTQEFKPLKSLHNTTSQHKDLSIPQKFIQRAREKRDQGEDYRHLSPEDGDLSSLNSLFSQSAKFETGNPHGDLQFNPDWRDE